jgi:hypothetical protein
MTRIALITMVLGVACSHPPAPEKGIDPRAVDACLDDALHVALLACWSGPNEKAWPEHAGSCMWDLLAGSQEPSTLFWRCTHEPQSVNRNEFDSRVIGRSKRP